MATFLISARTMLAPGNSLVGGTNGNVIKALGDAYIAEVAQLLTGFLGDTAQPADRIESAMQLIADGSGDPDFDVSSLASTLGMSRAHFTRQFSRPFNHSPGTAITQARLSAACELLEMTDMAISDVAQRSGFADHSWFGVVFRRQYACSPNLAATPIALATNHYLHPSTLPSTNSPIRLLNNLTLDVNKS